MQFGNTLIQDKVLVGLSAGLVGQPYETLIQEYLGLPLKDTVKEKWLYGNAARVFGLLTRDAACSMHAWHSRSDDHDRQRLRSRGESPGLAGRRPGRPLEASWSSSSAGRLAGEFAGGLLADLGATVIKIEPPAARRCGAAARHCRRGLALLPVREPRQVLCGAERAARSTAGTWLAAARRRPTRSSRIWGRAGSRPQASSPDALAAAQSAPGPPAHLAVRPDRAAGRRARRRSHRAGLLGVQFTTGFPDRPPIPVTVPLAD